MIRAEIVGHSLSPQKEELISVLCTFPRIILAEVNTHRMLSKNTSSSRAIPFIKMLKAVKENPFVPIAWQKEHSGMQGSEYFNLDETEILKAKWLRARDRAIESALDLASGIFDMNEVFEYDEEGELVVLQTVVGVTKQLCNRLLEPFMWTTMLITGSRSGWDNFFNLRCPVYESHKGIQYKSWKDYVKDSSAFVGIELKDYSQIERLQKNKGMAEIHIMDLAEKIWDAVNDSIPVELNPGEWHIAFYNKIKEPLVWKLLPEGIKQVEWAKLYWETKVKISVAMAARTSYTVVGDEKEIDYEKMIQLHDRLLAQDPPHSSPLEHCARAMDEEEYENFIKGIVTSDEGGWYTNQNSKGWCNNFKGFIPYRYLVDNKLLSL